MTALFAPKSVNEFSALLVECGERKKHFVAGGTDWLIKTRGNISDEAAVFDMSKMPELRGIEIIDSSLRLGAMETMTSIHSNMTVMLNATALSDAASSMGSVQIRNRATVGGNLANASPAADTPCALAALGASVIVFSISGRKVLSIEEVLGSCPNTNTLLPNEIIMEFCVPVRKGYVSAFKKIGSRSEVSIARVNMAVSAKYEGETFSDARVFVGTLGSAAKRCLGAENTLALDPSLREQSFKEALCEFAEQMIPGRSTLSYKKSVLKALAEDLLGMLEERVRVSEKSGEESHG